MSIVKKGWLKTRDGNYFTPMVLDNAIQTTDGQLFSDVVNENFNDLKYQLEETNRVLSSFDEEITEKLKNFNGDGSDTFYIVDKNFNKILQVDQNGLQTTDIQIDGYKSLYETLQNLQTSIDIEILNRQNTDNNIYDEINDRLKNFNGNNSDTFYIVDKSFNIILQVDKDGLYTTDIKTENYSSLNQTLQNLQNNINTEVTTRENDVNIEIFNRQNADNNIIDEINNRLKNFNGDASDTFYIIDSKFNAILQVNENGLRTTDIEIEDYPSLRTALDVLQSNIDVEGEIRQTEDKQLIDNDDNIQEELSETNNAIRNYKDDGSDTLYIVDPKMNIIAKVDSTGITTINLSIEGYPDLQNILEELYDNRDQLLLNADDLGNNIEALRDAIRNYRDDGSDVFYITDNNGNKIAQVNSEGITSTNFLIPNQRSLLEMATQIDDNYQGLGTLQASVLYYTLDGAIELNI